MQKFSGKPERADFRPERADFRPERAWGGGDRRKDKQKSPCVLQDFVPFGAAAQKLILRPERSDL